MPTWGAASRRGCALAQSHASNLLEIVSRTFAALVARNQGRCCFNASDWLRRPRVWTSLPLHVGLVVSVAIITESMRDATRRQMFSSDLEALPPSLSRSFGREQV
jgi:hypothetical protein